MGMQGKNAQFLVTSEQLQKSAQVIKDATGKANKEVVHFLSLLQETEGCFCGRAKEVFVGRGREIFAEWQNVLNGLHNNAFALQEIAEAYKTTEGENVGVIMENGS